MRKTALFSAAAAFLLPLSLSAICVGPLCVGEGRYYDDDYYYPNYWDRGIYLGNPEYRDYYYYGSPYRRNYYPEYRGDYYYNRYPGAYRYSDRNFNRDRDWDRGDDWNRGSYNRDYNREDWDRGSYSDWDNDRGGDWDRNSNRRGDRSLNRDSSWDRDGSQGSPRDTRFKDPENSRQDGGRKVETSYRGNRPVHYEDYLDFLDYLSYEDSKNDIRDRNGPHADRNNGMDSTPDSDLKQEIQDKLAKGWFQKGYNDVQVEVNNGTVTLKGTVDSESELIDVEKRVSKIDGVKNVVNNVHVTSQAANPPKSYTKDRASSY